MKTTKLNDFCKERSMQVQTAAKYIRSHPELFEGHYIKSGKVTFLDDIALEILEQMYPAPNSTKQPLAPSDSELAREIVELSKSNRQMIERIQQLEKKLQDAEANQKLLEYHQEQHEILQQKLENAKYQTQTAQQKLAAKEQEIESKQDKIDQQAEQISTLKDENAAQKRELEQFERTWFGFYKKKKG